MELAQALTEAATALIRHRERNPAPDDGETSSFNEALDKWTAKIDAINGRAPPIESDDPVRDDLERKIEAMAPRPTPSAATQQWWTCMIERAGSWSARAKIGMPISALELSATGGTASATGRHKQGKPFANGAGQADNLPFSASRSLS